MRSGLRPFLALLLLISFGGNLWAAARPHCRLPGASGAAIASHAHHGVAQHGLARAPSVAAQDGHECAHCPPADCRTAEHCPAGATVGLSAAAPALHVAAAWVRPVSSPRDPPRSADLTPPIPPPQVLL